MAAATSPQATHAVVLGASMAGLLAARVLAERHDRVTLVDRDPVAVLAGPRRGVPQGRHLHVLHPRDRCGVMTAHEWDALVVLTSRFEGLAQTLVSDHQADAYGRCMGCELPQNGGCVWPCTLHNLGTAAVRARAAWRQPVR